MSDPAVTTTSTTSETPVPVTFDLAGPLPSGTTVLEASAGTGKTYAIAALAARYVAEAGIELADLMMVTFGRMATDELRDRVRDRLLQTEAQLAAVLAGADPASFDPVGRLLAAVAPAEARRRHERVTRALADFDAATIATTHEFCLRMLDGLGVLGDRQPDAVFVEHLVDLTAEVTDDVFLSRYATEGGGLPYELAGQLARRAVGDGHADLVPRSDNAGSDAARERVAYATQVRDEVGRRKDRARLFTYDDMLTRLRDALANPTHGETAARRLRTRFRVVLVDEFQDTDPVQWEILRRAFHGHTTLILIGDPKQAIYAFRGADVYSYLDAVRHADTRATLDTNFRTDQALLDSLQSLMGGAALGESDIVVRPVSAHHRQSRLLGAGGDPVDPLRIRVVPPRPSAEDPDQPTRVGELRPQIEEDLVADVGRLLRGGHRLRAPDGAPRQPDRPLRACDIAVLVRTNTRGESIRDALQAADIPAVMLGSTSVFAGPVARDWQGLLVALAEPRQANTRRAALTCFLGRTAHDLALADDAFLTGLSQRIRFWSRVLAARGVAALLEVVSTDTDLTRRLLAQVNGERTLTDIRHIGQALHAAMTAGRLGPAALVEWLSDRIAETDPGKGGAGGPDVIRRLETDADAVQILTLHRSKGLEFPVVYLPEAWDKREDSQDEGLPILVHERDETGAQRSVLDVGGLTGSGRAERRARQLDEDAGEELRLLYVGLTRAGCQAVTWWANSWNTPTSPLHRFLSRPAGSPAVERRYPVLGDPVSEFGSHAGVRWEVVGATPPPRTADPAEATTPAGPLAGSLAVRRFDRELDLDWRRTSYSSLTAAAHGIEVPLAGVDSEAERVREDDEPVEESPDLAGGTRPVVEAESSGRDGLRQPSPLQDFPGGTDFGTLVHAVLETVDPHAGDLALALQASAATAIAEFGPDSTSATDLATALLPSMQTPLGPLAGNRTLADIAAADRLPELGFELPLAGGDDSTGRLRLGDLVPLLRRTLADDDPLAGYPERLAHPLLADQPLRGYLTGSIDAVLRINAATDPRYLVVDYKTNWLGSFDGPSLTLGDYTPVKMAEAMMRAHYPLQALLYCVAVHRMLRWRQAGYDPERHLGGVLYLFVRGMAGAATPIVDGSACGVFSWRPPTRLVVELSDLLDRGEPAPEGRA